MKRKPFNFTAYDIDIFGQRESFQVPDSALYFGTGQATISEEMKLERVKEKLCCKAYDAFDLSDVLIHDLDDKIAVVKRLRKTGHWGKKVEKVRK